MGWPESGKAFYIVRLPVEVTHQKISCSEGFICCNLSIDIGYLPNLLAATRTVSPR